MAKYPIYAEGSGPGVEVADEGVTVLVPAVKMNFTGGGVQATDNGDGSVDINIAGGGLTPTLAQVMAQGASAAAGAITDLADPTDPQDAATKQYVLDTVPAAAPTKIVLSGAGGWPSATDGCAGPTAAETTTNKLNVKTLDFADGAAVLFAEWTAVLPANYAGGTITAKFLWSAPGTGTETVLWGIAARAFGDDVALDAAFGTPQEIEDAHTATAGNVLISDATPACTIAGTTPTAGQMVQFRVYRDPTGDTLAQTASLYAVEVSY